MGIPTHRQGLDRATSCENEATTRYEKFKANTNEAIRIIESNITTWNETSIARPKGSWDYSEQREISLFKTFDAKIKHLGLQIRRSFPLMRIYSLSDLKYVHYGDPDKVIVTDQDIQDKLGAIAAYPRSRIDTRKRSWVKLPKHNPEDEDLWWVFELIPLETSES